MKTTILLFTFIVMIHSSSFSQQLSTSGQSNLKFYNKAIERLQKMSPGSMGYEEAIMDAEKKISSIKKTDPSYNVSSLESEIKSYREKIQADSNDNPSKKGATNGSSMDMNKFNLLLSKNTKLYNNLKNESELNKLIAEVDSYEKEVSSFASQYGDQSNNLSAKNSAEDGWETYLPDATTIFYAKKNSDRIEDPIYTKANYYKVKLVKVKWEAMQKMFPKSDVIIEASKKSTAAFNDLGTLDELVKKSEKTKANNLAEVKMNPPAVKDPSFEAEIKKALAGHKDAAGKQIIKINILSSDWTVQHNSITGVIISRTKAFEAVWKESDGTCTLFHYADIKQDYNGSGYGKNYISLGDKTQILCENVK